MKIFKSLKNTSRQQRGFTLLEIIVGLVLLGILAVAVTGSFDGSRSRAQSLLSQMNEFKSANIRLKQDTGCYALNAALLFDPRQADVTASNSCAKQLGRTYNGPYMQAFPLSTDDPTAAAIDKVSPQARVNFLAASTAGTEAFAGRRIYILEASDVEEDVVRAFLVECNGEDTNRTTFDGRTQCYGNAATGAVQIVMDVTR